VGQLSPCDGDRAGDFVRAPNRISAKAPTPSIQSDVSPIRGIARDVGSYDIEKTLTCADITVVRVRTTRATDYLLPLRGLSMKTTTLPVSRQQFPSRSGLITRVPDFIALTKPRVMALAVFTAAVGLFMAPGRLDPLLGAVALIGIAAGAGAAAVLNMWYDADIDALMTRTSRRPIPKGEVSRFEALGFGLALACGAVVVLGVALNVAAAALLAFTIFFYIVVYTIWLKRRTPHNIVIGGAAGALPPLIGWMAATGTIGLEPLILFLIIFLWTPPHFWALSLNRTDDYARAGVPMLPVVGGSTATARQILIYSLLLVPTSVLPCVLGFAGILYGATTVASGTIFIVIAVQLNRSRGADRHAAQRLFVFSISYLFLLFAALLADHQIDRWSTMAATDGAGPVLAARLTAAFTVEDA
jgi:protoheme IX farnesyltransferase